MTHGAQPVGFTDNGQLTTTMLLHIIRHAWAEDRDPEKYPNDDVRPLTGEGKKRFGKTIERIFRRRLPADNRRDQPAGVFVREIFPGGAAGGIILADGAPLALGQVRAETFPRLEAVPFLVEPDFFSDERHV